MSDNSYFPVPESAAKGAHVDNDGYLEMYKRSVDDPEGFWAEHGKRVDWAKPFTKVKNVSYGPGNVEIKWFEDGELNVSHNCIDRHLEKRGDQTAIIWEVTIRAKTRKSPTASYMKTSVSLQTS